jgi:type I restriction enzyme S subunit
MGVRAGYKQTEVGLIPDDWDVLDFDEACRRLNGKAHQIQTSQYAPTGAIPVIDQGQVPIVGYSDSASLAFKVPDGGVLVFGDHTCIVKFVNFDFIVGADGTQLIATKPGQCTRFRAYDLEHTGIASTGYNRHFKFLRERKFVSPSEGEQRAIAAALSDVDALLDGLERLIAKKRDLKQATMQQLLTGQTRLPGFSGEWDIRRLGEICDISMGRTPARLNRSFWGRGHKWLSIADLQSKVISESKEEVTDAGAALMSVVPAGTLLMSFKLSIGRLAFAGCDLYTNEAICAFNHLQADAAFMYYALGRTDFSLYGKQAVKGYTLNSESLRSVEVRLPSNEEQVAISTLLSDMDDEIVALEARRDKTRALKQGMMQELLTGKTRLVNGGARV